jgi:hypothetical protein
MLRVYGRTRDILTGAKTWQVVTTDARGGNDQVYLTALIQCIKLNWNESPVYGNWGIPAHQSILSQVAPNLAMNLMQQRYAQYFASLIITRVPDGVDEDGRPAPAYLVNVIFKSGQKVEQVVPF